MQSSRLLGFRATPELCRRAERRAAEMTQKNGKHVSVAEVLRQALLRFLKRKP